jgi:hypothetical protein
MAQEVQKQIKGQHHVYYQVGIAKVGTRVLRYSDLPRSNTGWITDLRFRPYNFDLVFLKVKDRDKPVSAWWSGRIWEGRLWKQEYKVLAWKRNENWD